MKVSDINLSVIAELLASVPDGCECESIILTDDKYQLRLIAGTDQIRAKKQELSLEELNIILSQYENKKLSANKNTRLKP